MLFARFRWYVSNMMAVTSPAINDQIAIDSGVCSVFQASKPASVATEVTLVRLRVREAI